MGDAGHQLSAGLIISGAAFLLLQQMFLHTVEGGAHRGELVPVLVLHWLGKIPRFYPACGLGQGVYRLEQLSELISGEQGVQQKDGYDGRAATEKQREHQHLRLGAARPCLLGMDLGDRAYQLQPSAVPFHPECARFRAVVRRQLPDHLFRLFPVVLSNGLGDCTVYCQHGDQSDQHRYGVVKKEVPPDPHNLPSQ